MLQFFRRYQRAVFIVITFVIVISFSFFGTFQTFSGKDQEDKVAFTAVDGSKVRRSELNDMINFLASDSHDYLFSASNSGNGLNDGVVVNDILDSGLAQVITSPYLAQIGEEQQVRLEREKRYNPYTHPKAPFLTAEQVWAYYAPDIKTNFDLLRSFETTKSEEAFSARVDLFMAERHFPSAYLKQFLRYQEMQHKWLPQDPNLAYQDLSLFGYHNVQDWFGRQFIELCAQFVINSAKIAQAKGYTVTKEEVIGSLFRNAESAYRQSRSQGMMTATNVGDYFTEQLRRLGMDQSRAVKLWTDVLLFRTLFFDNADSVLVDRTSYNSFYHYQNEYVDIDLFQLPKDLRFATVRDLEQFALYLNAVRLPEEAAKQSDPLNIPKEFLAARDVKKVYPELVERKIFLRYATLNKDQLQTKIGVKNTWEWQVADKNWKTLRGRYPELANYPDNTVEERLQALDRLEPARRAMLDSYSRSQIVDEHPEWIKQALQEAPTKEEELALRAQGGKTPFEGVKNTVELIKLLDSVPLNEESEQLATYTQDNQHYVRILVLDRSKPEALLTFAEAKGDGTLDRLLDKTLETSYPRLKTKEPSLFLTESGDWKPFNDVKDNVALLYFADLFKKLELEIDLYKKHLPDFTDWSDRQKALVAISLLPLVREKQEEVKESLAKSTEWLDEQETASETATPSQFKLVKSRERLVRRDPTFAVNPELAFSLEKETLSGLTNYQSSGPSFFIVMAKGYLPSDEQVRAKVLEERSLLGREALAKLGGLLLTEMQKKGSIEIELVSKESTLAKQSEPKSASVSDNQSDKANG